MLELATPLPSLGCLYQQPQQGKSDSLAAKGSFTATFRSWAAHARSVGLGHLAPGSALFHIAPPPIKPPK